MKHLLSMGLVLLVLVGAALLNPSRDRHRDAIADEYTKADPLTGWLGLGHALAGATTYHNYVFFSTTTLGEEKISTGYAGRVGVRPLDLDDLPDAALEMLPEDVRRHLDR